MKFALLSDLHLEFAQYEEALPEADVLLLAGDISSMRPSSMRKELQFRARCHEKYGEENIIQIGGNHEMYDGVWEDSELIVREYGDTVVIACTLWSGAESEMAYKFMNDSRLIEKWSWKKMLADHQRCVDFIVEQLEKHKDKKTVVMTHHLPSLASIDEKYLLDESKHFINYGFYTDLDWILDKYAPTVWVHGHTHSSIDKQVKNTRILCNPRGYTSFRGIENKQFDPKKTFDV